MKRLNIVVFGKGGHSKVIQDILSCQGLYTIAMVADLHDEEAAIRDFSMGIIGLGKGYLRQRLAEKIKGLRPDFQFVTAVHPSATLARGVSLGAGTAIMAQAVINSGSILGEHCVVNTAAALDHDCLLEDFAFVAPGARIAGEVNIRKGAFIGLGSNVVQGIDVGAWSLVAAGATVVKNVPAGSLVMGLPARVVRDLTPEQVGP